MNNAELVTWLEYLISIDRLDKFYHSKYFRKVKREVLRELHYECQRCKENGKLTIIRPNYKKSGVVHHVKELRKYPNLALSKYYIDDEGKRQRQLIVLCNECHEIVHNRFSPLKRKEPLNIERW